MPKRNGRAVVECIFCGKYFSSGQSLAAHTNLHTWERPFQCSLCDATFPSQPALRIHLKKAHNQKLSLRRMKSKMEKTSSSEAGGGAPDVSLAGEEEVQQLYNGREVPNGVEESFGDERGHEDGATVDNPIAEYFYAGSTPMPSPASSLSPGKEEELLDINGNLDERAIDVEEKVEVNGEGGDPIEDVMETSKNSEDAPSAPAEHADCCEDTKEVDPPMRVGGDVTLGGHSSKAAVASPNQKLGGGGGSASGMGRLPPNSEPEKSLYSCLFCNLQFIEKIKLKNHIEENHSIRFAMAKAAARRFQHK